MNATGQIKIVEKMYLRFVNECSQILLIRDHEEREFSLACLELCFVAEMEEQSMILCYEWKSELMFRLNQPLPILPKI